MRSFIALIVGFFLLQLPTLAKSEVIKSFDNFELPYFFEKASNHLKNTTVIFVHGSGPTDADGNFTNITQPQGTENRVYKDLAIVLRNRGYHTLRFHKRSYVISHLIQKDPSYQIRPEMMEFDKAPVQTLVKDVMAVVAWAKANHPKDKIILFGHSQGVQISLFALSRNLPVDGLVLSGFSNEPQAFLILEQTLFRAQRIIFSSLDTNHDFLISKRELSGSSPYARAIAPQLKTIDSNSDGQIDINEFLAGNYSNLILNDKILGRNYLLDELKFQRPSEIVKASSIPIVFVSALNDNQTPPYFTQALELANEASWKKTNLSFVYLPGVGHSFGTRPYDTLYFTKPKASTLKKIGRAFPD